MDRTWTSLPRMEWTLFALLQMFIITVGVSCALWLRIRGVRRQNAEMRAYIEDLPAPDTDAAPSGSEWVETRLAELDAESPGAGVVRVVLQHQLEANENFEEALREAIASCGWSGADAGETDARIAELEAELAAAREALEENAGEGASERNEELKNLLQQFTRDSREMMACIQTLESENARLREQLGLDDDSSATEDAA